MADFEIQNGVLKKYNGPGGDVVVPAGVTSIGDMAFDGCSSLTSIELPAGVVSIGERAFFGCSRLASIVLPESVMNIEENAFEGCKLLVIPISRKL